MCSKNIYIRVGIAEILTLSYTSMMTSSAHDAKKNEYKWTFNEEL